MDGPTPKRIKRHRLNPDHIDANALDVIEQLSRHGFEALLVGGCVRDSLCGVVPKDFDVATNATPEEVKRIFRRSRLVGRRFPIAHVRYGRELIEVSTFRQSKHDEIELDAAGMILKDRAFGSIAEDAFRRDFTVNALYYDPESNEVIDYVGGVQDIQARRIRFIGQASERLAEDPVRVLRAIRFSAKLGFDIDSDIVADLDDTAARLAAIPRARLFDEFLKLFLSGIARPVWDLLRDTPLRAVLFPSTDPSCELVAAAMSNTDARVADDQPVTPGFLIAILLWRDFCARVDELAPKRRSAGLHDAAFKTLAEQQHAISIPRRYGNFAREVWTLQDRLVARNPRSVTRLAHHKRFRAAFDFLTLRAQSDASLTEAADWWTQFQECDGDGQRAMIASLPRQPRQRKRRKRKRGGQARSSSDVSSSDVSSSDVSSSDVSSSDVSSSDVSEGNS